MPTDLVPSTQVLSNNATLVVELANSTHAHTPMARAGAKQTTAQLRRVRTNAKKIARFQPHASVFVFWRRETLPLKLRPRRLHQVRRHAAMLRPGEPGHPLKVPAHHLGEVQLTQQRNTLGAPTSARPDADDIKQRARHPRHGVASKHDER